MKRILAVLSLIAICTVATAAPTTAAARKPDLVVSAQSGIDAYTYTYEFHDDPAYSGDYCDIQEGLISSPGVHRLLAFTAGTRNIGDADLVVGNPRNNPDYAYSACHDHYHFDGYARYRLLDATGGEVVASNKMGFCIVDGWPPDTWDPFDPRQRQRFTDCNRQGLSVGWSDNYAATVHGQWIEIDNIAPGDYILEITINWEQKLPERDYTNNSATFPVTITATD